MMILKTRLSQSPEKEWFSPKAIRRLTLLLLFFMAGFTPAHARENFDKLNLLKGRNLGDPLRYAPTSYLENFKTITGTVMDNNGNVLSGVSITLQGTQKGTSTDAEGHFTIEANAGQVLQVSMVGYKAKTVIVGAENDLTISMELEATMDTEIVIVGFGTQKKINVTGSVSTVDAKQLESRPVSNVGQALQGMVPGLNFSTSGLGGELNQNLSFNIRGTGTIGAGSNSSPLVLIDGMEGDMNALNPQDIATISVLKDAASASIYGSRAAFGVVLITTKKGTAGKAKINYNNNFRFSSPMGLPKMLDSYAFAMYYNEAAANDGEGAKFSTDIINKIRQYQNGEIDYGTEVNNNNRYNFYTGSFGNTDWFESQYQNS